MEEPVQVEEELLVLGHLGRHGYEPRLPSAGHRETNKTMFVAIGHSACLGPMENDPNIPKWVSNVCPASEYL